MTESASSVPGAWISPDPGIRRRVLNHVPQLMTVEVAFDRGAEGRPHSHPHVQASFVAEGRFRVTIDGHTRELGAGEAFVVAPDLVHGVVALEPGRLIDVFTPRRDDFL